jgi:hypothetical protein
MLPVFHFFNPSILLVKIRVLLLNHIANCHWNQMWIQNDSKDPELWHAEAREHFLYLARNNKNECDYSHLSSSCSRGRRVKRACLASGIERRLP